MDFTLPIILSIHVFIRQLLPYSVIDLLERKKNKIPTLENAQKLKMGQKKYHYDPDT